MKLAVGPLYWPDGRVPVYDQNQPHKKTARRSHMLLDGTVISLVGNSKWRVVYWGDLDCTGNHLSKQLNVLATASSLCTRNGQVVNQTGQCTLLPRSFNFFCFFSLNRVDFAFIAV